MDAPVGVAMLTVCLGVAGVLIHIAAHSDAVERRRYPRGRQTPAPLPRDPQIRTAVEQRALRAREPVLGASTEAGRRLQAETLRTQQSASNPLRAVSGPAYMPVGAEPEDAVPPGFEPRPH